LTAGPATSRRPAWWEAELRDRRRRGGRRSWWRPSRRLAVVYDVDAPRVRLGVLWFAAEVGALALGRFGVAVLLAGVCGFAGDQTAATWRTVRRRASRPVATAAAGAMPLAAAAHVGLLGAVLVAGAVASVVAGFVEAPRPGAAVVAAGVTVRSWLFAGLAGAAVVLAARAEPWSAVALVVLVAAYEVGDYLVGSGAGNAAEGPAAGMAGVLVATFVVSVVQVPPFDVNSAWAFGVAAAVLAPLGQLAGTLVLPAAAAPATALRRLDSLLLLGPVWAVAVSWYVAANPP
jgi:hypothetical protein